MQLHLITILPKNNLLQTQRVNDLSLILSVKKLASITYVQVSFSLIPIIKVHLFTLLATYLPNYVYLDHKFQKIF